MTNDYRIELTINGLPKITVHKADAPAFPGTTLLDGLTVSWAMPDSELWPKQPDPQQLSFSLLADQASDFKVINIGTAVLLKVFTGLPGDLPWIRYGGRVSDLKGFQVKVPGPDGPIEAWQLDVQCVDLTADLAELTIGGDLTSLLGPYDPGGADPYLTAPVENWAQFYFYYAGLGHLNSDGSALEGIPLDWTTGDSAGGADVPRPVDNKIPNAQLLQALADLLAAYADGGDVTGDPDVANNHALYPVQGWRRGLVQPDLDAWETAIFNPPTWRIDWVSRVNLSTYNAPTSGLKFGHVDALWGVIAAAPPATTKNPSTGAIVNVNDMTLILDGDYLDYGTAWVRNKRTSPNTVTVNSVGSVSDTPWLQVTRSNKRSNEQTILAQLDAPLARANAAGFVADMYLDDNPSQVTIWEADAFVWHASRDPQWPHKRTMFPDDPDTATGPAWAAYGAPVTIAGIPVNQDPRGAGRYTGVLKSAAATIAKGEIDVTFTLAARIPKNSGAALSAFTWTNYTDVGNRATPPASSAIRWVDLVPTDTWLDYRITRPAATDYPA